MKEASNLYRNESRRFNHVVYWAGEENGTREICHWPEHSRPALAQAAVYSKPPALRVGHPGEGCCLSDEGVASIHIALKL